MFTLERPHRDPPANGGGNIGGDTVFFSWQRTSGGYLATTGYDQKVHIYNRHAEVVEKIALPGMCSCFGWDKDGDLLAIITDRSSNMVIWDANMAKTQWLDTSNFNLQFLIFFLICFIILNISGSVVVGVYFC